MTIPKRLDEIIEEQKLSQKEANAFDSVKRWVAPVAATAFAAAQLGLDPAADAAAAAVDAGAIGGALATDTAVGAGTAAVETTVPALATDAAAGTGAGGGLASKALGYGKGALGYGKGLWNKLSPNMQKGVEIGTGSEAAKSLLKPNPNAGTSTGGSGVPPTMSAYGGGAGVGGALQLRPMMQASKQANPTMADIPKLLELILETLCGCGQPTAGKFNGMPHCIPGTGCSGGTGQDSCCSCGDPSASGSFHGESVCAPGQGCNSHWEPGTGMKWNPSMETPEEKVNDHDKWALSTNHGEHEMPNAASATTWE